MPHSDKNAHWNQVRWSHPPTSRCRQLIPVINEIDKISILEIVTPIAHEAKMHIVVMAKRVYPFPDVGHIVIRENRLRADELALTIVHVRHG